MSDLVSRLLEAIAETERLARAAVDPERPGTHWQWVTDENDTPVARGDLAEAQAHQAVSLRTVEEFETNTVGLLPAFLLWGQDVVPGAGDHIAHNDPAAVLRRCTADKRVLERHSPQTGTEGHFKGSLVCAGEADVDDPWLDKPWPCPDFEDLADRYGISVEEETTGE